MARIINTEEEVTIVNMEEDFTQVATKINMKKKDKVIMVEEENISLLVGRKIT